MKNILCLILSLMLAVTLFGCKSASTGDKTKGTQGKTVNDILAERSKETGKDLPSAPASSSGEPSSAKETDRQKSASAPESSSSKTSDTPKKTSTRAVDVDLTTMSSTMIYAEVNQMVTTPEKYMGKKIRMAGTFNYTQGNGKTYFACIISDATACCAQGIEFDLADQRKFPDEYPKSGAQITVSGVFTTYNEGTTRYCQLKDAVLES